MQHAKSANFTPAGKDVLGLAINKRVVHFRGMGTVYSQQAVCSMI